MQRYGPMVNQIELHVGQMQTEAVEYCKANGIQLEAWSPIGMGSADKPPCACGYCKKV